MQVPNVTSAATAAGILSQATSKDAASAALAAPDSSLNPHVEKSNSPSADRDAQGQGDGLRDHQHRLDELEIEDILTSEEHSVAAPRLPDDPPSELDIVA